MKDYSHLKHKWYLYWNEHVYVSHKQKYINKVIWKQ